MFDIPAWLSAFKYFVSDVISRCAVPGFFFMAAMFLYRKPFSWKENVRKKIKTLLIPYIIINSIWIGIYFCFQQIPSLSPYFSKPYNIVANWDMMGWLKAYFFNARIIVVPTWFMRDLFVLNLLALFIVKILDKFPKTSAIILLLAWICVPTEPFYKNFHWELQAVCFFCLGCLFVRQNLKLETFDKIPKFINLGIYIILLVADLLSREQPWNLFIHRFCALYGIIFWYSCFTKFKAGSLKNFLLGFSTFSFSIYIFHENMLRVVQKIFARIFPATPVFQLFLYVFVPMLIILYCVTLSVFLKKYFPRAHALITGSR